MKKIIAFVLALILMAIPLSSFAHEWWCDIIKGNANIATVVNAFTVSTSISHSYNNKTETTHNHIKITKKHCSICGDTWETGRTETTESHNWIVTVEGGQATRHCSGCGLTRKMR